MATDLTYYKHKSYLFLSSFCTAIINGYDNSRLLLNLTKTFAAEIFAKMLEFNANLPESYDDTLGWSKSGRANGMSYSDFQKAQLDYLQNLLDQAGTKHSDAA